MTQMSIFALAAACALASLLFTAVSADDEGAPIFGVRIPAGYREWELITVSSKATRGNIDAAINLVWKGGFVVRIGEQRRDP